MTSPQKLSNKLTHAKRESQALKAQLEDSRLKAEELLASFEKSVYTPEAMARRNMFKRARELYRG
jgi:hypothetical protein